MKRVNPKREVAQLPRRVPQVRVSRPAFHLVEHLATKHASARIFLQHLAVRK